MSISETYTLLLRIIGMSETLIFLLGALSITVISVIDGIIREWLRDKKYCSKCGRVLLIYDKYVYSIDITLREAHELYEETNRRIDG
jgi:hypothetical protein